MSDKRYLGNIITQNPTAPSGPYEDSTAPGVWSLAEAFAYSKAGLWPTAGNVAPGQQAYTSAGSYSWVAPAGVTSVSVVAVGGGGGGKCILAVCLAGMGMLCKETAITVTGPSRFRS